MGTIWRRQVCLLVHRPLDVHQPDLWQPVWTEQRPVYLQPGLRGTSEQVLSRDGWNGTTSGTILGTSSSATSLGTTSPSTTTMGTTSPTTSTTPSPTPSHLPNPST